MKGLVVRGRDVKRDGRRWWKATERQAGKGGGVQNRQIAQSKPHACVEANLGEACSVDAVWIKSSPGVLSLHTCSPLDEVPDHLEPNHRMHVKKPAGSWDNMVFYTHTYSIIPPHLLHSTSPPSAVATPILPLKFTHSDCIWLQSRSVPPAECAGGGPRLGPSIFQAPSALSLMEVHGPLRIQWGGADGETEQEGKG